MQRKETLEEKKVMGASSEEAMAAVVEGEDSAGDGVVWEELPAPPGWKKKVAQRRGGTPRRGDVTFVAADGEEIKSKRQLERYLKANPGGPPIADFDWGTGEIPRRSERLSSRKRFSDFGVEPEPTTPRRGRKKKAVAAIKSSEEEGLAKDSDKAEEDNAKEEDESGAAKAEAEEAKKNEAAPDKAEKGSPSPASEDQAKQGTVKASASPSPAPVSCAKTETMAKSQETQPAQIGVSS